MDLYTTVKNSVTPEDDPVAEKRLDSESKETLGHIATNSGRAFFWKELAQYAITATAIFGGIAIGGAGVAGLSATTALAIAGGTGLVGLISSVIAHRIEVKNELSLEELYARRTGQCVADSIAEKSRETGKPIIKHPTSPLPPMPYQEALHLSGRFQMRDDATQQELPQTRISGDQITGEQIILPEKTLH